ncbi:MAG TPA: amidohydrolase, partial [Bacillota bacterium]|nr:amidohydrolase [Bacillota bacterium]
MDVGTIKATIEQNHDWVVQVRRTLHQHPELGTEEHWTGDTIAKYLDELKIPYHRGIAETGI